MIVFNPWQMVVALVMMVGVGSCLAFSTQSTLELEHLIWVVPSLDHFCRRP